MTNTNKWCLLNTDLRSVSNAAQRKLWHSYQRFWNAPIVVLIIIAHCWTEEEIIISFQSALSDSKNAVVVIFWALCYAVGERDFGLDLLKRAGLGE
jgi:hypothetical protein